ncbi:unnamed protein product [Durusdinium trenchii]|uniref:Uncharacterized protein n=1 Tax=Durusdinium trenchii TaxID=1381693 RepID=A0ABP0PWA2_9DINO
MGLTSEDPLSPSGGRHTQFKEALKLELRSRLSKSVRSNAGLSFDERIEIAAKAKHDETSKQELAQRKVLQDAVEKGRSRPTSAPVRPSKLSPNQQAMLQERIRKMKEQEDAYKKQVLEMRQRMKDREPLFRLSEVQAGFEMLRQQQDERRRELQHEEHQRWEHLRAVEVNAFQRPLLIEDFNYRPPRARSECWDGRVSARDGTSRMEPSEPALDSEDFDERLRAAVAGRWFKESDWGKKLKEMKEKVDNRQKLHEIRYPQKCDSHKLPKTRLMHALIARAPNIRV